MVSDLELTEEVGRYFLFYSEHSREKTLFYNRNYSYKFIYYVVACYRVPSATTQLVAFGKP